MRYHNVCAEFDADVIEKFMSELVPPNQQRRWYKGCQAYDAGLCCGKIFLIFK